MKRLLLLIPAVLLTGCLTTIPPFPEVPKELLQACPDLKTVDSQNDKLSAIVETVADNYKQYYDCKAKVDYWVEWYNGQKKIRDSVK
jgi:hypothetical protein